MNGSLIDPPVSVDVRRQILDHLADTERRENITILFAVESGSRAWGFPSPDSDYDARFVYARPLDWYVSLEPGRDVLELPIENDLDINGWDLKKALGLLLKPNPVLLEWLSSPIRYVWRDDVCDRLFEFSQRVAHGPACLHHYLSIGQRQWNVYVDGKTNVNLKKYFYIVRPALALQWIDKHPTIVPPMNFQDLVAGLDLPEVLNSSLQDLLVRKSQSKELGSAPRIPIIDEFILSSFDRARRMTVEIDSQKVNLDARADDLFRSILKEVSL